MWSIVERQGIICFYRIFFKLLCKATPMKAKFLLFLLLPMLLISELFAQQEIPSVRVVYLVSADRQERSDYKAAIKMAVLDIQKWYRKQMNGRTFRLNDPVVEVLQSNQPASWFTGTPIPGVGEGDWGFQHTLSEIRRLLPNEAIPGNYTWVMYSDGPGSSGRGGGQLCYLPEDDLLGLTGKHPTQPDILRWIAGLGHEIGHAFGLPHPADTKKYEDAIMWTGIYGKYPDQTYLTPDDKKLLLESPFFKTDEEIEAGKPVSQTTYSYHGGEFVRYKARDGSAYWIENASDGSTFRFEETKNDGTYYYAFGRSFITLKIPMKGGASYFSDTNGQYWNTNHYVTITVDQKLGDDLTGDIKVSNPVNKAKVMQDCQPVQKLGPTAPNEAVEITFVNHTSREVRLFWISHDQQPIQYHILRPDERFLQPTYTNHWWMAKSMSGECLGVFKSTDARPVVVDIEPKVATIRMYTADEAVIKKN